MGCTSSRIEAGLDHENDLEHRTVLSSKLAPPMKTISESSSKAKVLQHERISWRRGDLIGTGANGRVYLGLEEDTGAIIAVKEVMFTKDALVNCL